jgi:hypothetical protein
MKDRLLAVKVSMSTMVFKARALPLFIDITLLNCY